MIDKFQDNILSFLNNPKFKNALKGIYLQVPGNSSFPYIVLSDFSAKRASTKTDEKSEITFKVNLFSRDSSLKKIFELISLIKIELKVLIPKIRLSEEKINFHTDGSTKHIILLYNVRQ